MLIYIIEYMSYTSTIFRILNYDTLSDEDKSIIIDVINKWETIITSSPDNVYVDLNIYISTLGSGVLGGATLETVYQLSTQTYMCNSHACEYSMRRTCKTWPRLLSIPILTNDTLRSTPDSKYTA